MIFCDGMSFKEAVEFEAFLRIPLAFLPIRYLGFPLSSRRLSYVYCSPLLERVTNYVKSWSVRALFLCWSIMLIWSIMQSFQVYWASVFVLPTKVTRNFDSLLCYFLWRGKVESGGRTRLLGWMFIFCVVRVARHS